MKTKQGVVFRESVNNSVSSMVVGQKIFANSLKHKKPELAARIICEKNWRAKYQYYMDEIYLTNFTSASSGLEIAKAGLGQINRSFEFVRGERRLSLAVAMKFLRDSPIFKHAIVGKNYRAVRKDLPPIWHKHISLLESWTESGIMEPCLRKQINEVLENPDWLNLQNQYFVILGATAEINAVEHLLALGATVIAIARKKPEKWYKLIEMANNSAGRLIIPVSESLSEEVCIDDIVHVAGVDLITDTPEIAQWLCDLKRPLHLCCSAYLDGADHVRVSVAMDLIAQTLKEKDFLASLSYSLTPTDVYMVPENALRESCQRRKKLSCQNAVKRLLSLFSFGYLCKPNIRHKIQIGLETQVGLVNSIVRQQGPNYILAKRIQRWRAIVARSEGVRVSCNVVPAVRTQSVLKNALFKVGYEGAENFGVRMFDPEEVNVLLTLLLIQNICSPFSYSNPNVDLQHPEYLFVQGANHGGIWRSAEQFESMLPLGVLAGYSKQLARKLIAGLSLNRVTMS